MTTSLQYVDTADATCTLDRCHARGKYRLAGRCANCGWTGAVLLTLGHQAPHRVECPCCECRSVICLTRAEAA